MINRSKMLSTGRFQIGRFVQFSASRFFVFHHQDLVSQQGLPCVHLCSLSTWQGLPKRGLKDNCTEPGRVPRSRLRLLVSYWNNNVCSYTTASNSKRNVNDNRPHFLQNITTSNARTFSIVPVALLVIIGAGLLVHYNDERRAIPRASEQDTKRNVQNVLSKPSIGGPFKLINYEGKVVTDRNFLGHWTLIYFGYTSSPDVGPDEVQKLARAVDILELKENIKINPVFITLDPLRDTPSQLRAYLQEFHPKIIGLAGPVNAIRQVAQEYRVYFKKKDEEGSDYLIDCSHNMYLMDPNMEFVRIFGVEYNADQLVDEIVSEVKKASKSFSAA